MKEADELQRWVSIRTREIERQKNGWIKVETGHQLFLNDCVLPEGKNNKYSL